MKYKIKRFTRADKAAMREIYRYTNGFRSFPKGARNLNARDIFRLKDISREKEGSAFEVFNNETGKNLLNKMGLEKLGKDIEHLNYKFGNEELHKRWRKIYHPEIAKENDNYKKFGKLINYLEKRETNGLKDITRKANIALSKKDKQQKRLASLANEEYLEGKKNKNFVKKHLNKIVSAGKNDIERIKEKAYEESGKLQGKYYPLKMKAKMEYNNSKYNLDELIYNETTDNPILQKIKRNVDKADDDFKEKLSKGKKLSSKDKKLRDKFIERAKKRDKVKVELVDSNKSCAFKDGIKVSKNANPFVAGHEAGHVRFNRQSGGGNHYRDPNDLFRKTNVEDTIDEAAASGHSLSGGKILGATPKQLKEGREVIEGAFNTYARNLYRRDISNFVRNIYRNKEED